MPSICVGESGGGSICSSDCAICILLLYSKTLLRLDEILEWNTKRAVLAMLFSFQRHLWSLRDRCKMLRLTDVNGTLPYSHVKVHNTRGQPFPTGFLNLVPMCIVKKTTGHITHRTWTLPCIFEALWISASDGQGGNISDISMELSHQHVRMFKSYFDWRRIKMLSTSPVFLVSTTV